jgi:hypothetical protein
MFNVLNRLHKEFLNSFPFKSTDFYLTGGTALSAFYLEHRFSDGLDLFTPQKRDFDHLDILIRDLIENIGGEWLADTTAPSYRRGFWRHEGKNEQIKIDFVHETVEQVIKNKPVKENIRIDTPEDICANKINTLLSRYEFKDAIDLFFLHLEGYEPEQYFKHAQKKDAGLTTEIFSQITASVRIHSWPDYMLKTPPIEELNTFYQQLSQKFAIKSYPEQKE